MEGAKAIEVASMGKIFVTNVNVIDVFSNKTFRKLFTIPIPLLKDEAREPNEIIGIQGSPDEKWIAIVTGKNLIMDEQKQNQLFIFKKQPKSKSNND